MAENGRKIKKLLVANRSEIAIAKSDECPLL